MKTVQVRRLADLPQEPIYAFLAKSIEEAEAWGRRHQAGTIWIYLHRPNRGMQFVTAARLVLEEARRIEQASADLVQMAEEAAQ